MERNGAGPLGGDTPRTTDAGSRFFFPDAVDRDLIVLRHTKRHQPGFALQLCTVRYAGAGLGGPPCGAKPVVGQRPRSGASSG